MESKHFSHKHGLIFDQMPRGSKAHCSGCKSPGLDNAYVCWQCNYFLHEQCFRATRSLKHPSHPHHPLTLAPFPTYSSGSFVCKYCNLGGKGFSYSCSECEFDIHVHCAHMTNAHTSNPQPHNQIYASNTQNNAFPTYPPRNPTTPNDVQSYPPPPQPQVTSFPPNPNNPNYPNSSPPNTKIPNQTQNYGGPQTYSPNQNNTIPTFPQPNPNFVNGPHPNPNLSQPNTKLPNQTQNHSISHTNAYPPNQDNRIPVFNFPHSSHPNTPSPNQTQNYTGMHQPQQYPTHPNAYPPNQNNQSHVFSNFPTSNTTIPNQTQNYPTHINTYSPNPSTFSNLSTPNPTTPNQAQNYASPITNTYPPNQNNHLSAFPEPSPNFSRPSSPNPPPLPPPQPYTAFPTYSTTVNATTPNSPPAPPPVLQSAPIENNHITAYPESSPQFSSVPSPNPPSPPPPQPYATTNTSPLPPPPVYQSTPTQYPQTNPPQSRSPTSTHHFSHPHPMTATQIEQNDAKVCSACNCKLSGSAYSCTDPHCTFNLHTTCFDSPPEIRHNSHPHHPLTLHPVPPYNDGYTCDACQKHGNTFVYNCATCSYDLHINCVKWPETITRPDHKHNLTLQYSSPVADANQHVTFTCDVCKNSVHKMAWMYYCRECDFGTHLECVGCEVKHVTVSPSGKTEEELLRMQEELRLHALEMKISNESRKAMLKLWDSDSD